MRRAPRSRRKSERPEVAPTPRTFASERPLERPEPPLVRVTVTNRTLPAAVPAVELGPDGPAEADTKLFAPEGSAEGCASGECLPGEEAALPAVVAVVPSLAATSSAAKWKVAVDAVRAAFPRHGKSLSFARLIAIAAGEVKVSFGQAHSFHRATVFGAARNDVESVLTRTLGGPHRLVEEKSQAVWTAAPKSIAELEAADRATREKSIEGRARDSVAVKSILRLLGGTVEHVQVLDAAPAEEPVAAPPDDDS